MTEEHPIDDAREPEPPQVQRWLDNLWLLLLLGVLIPTALYLLWGLWELVDLPTWGGSQ